nr:caspase family protein [uncultured Roseibium sp.]
MEADLRFLNVVLIGCLWLFAVPAYAQRLALVIGNADYAALEDLENAHADARAYHEALSDLGFKSALKLDLDFEATFDAIEALLGRVQPGDEVAFVYSGHGWSDGASNYLLPTDAPKQGGDRFLKRSSVALGNGHDGLLDELEQAGVSLTVAIIDACRNNPFTPRPGRRSVGISRGLSPITAPQGTFVIFSAGSGQEALDRLPDDPPGQSLSVFTRTFVPLLSRGLYLEDAVAIAQEKTYEIALRYDGHQQQPSYYDETRCKTCLGRKCTSGTTPQQEDEIAFVQAVKTGTADALRIFIDTYPDSSLKVPAKNQLARLMEPPVPEPVQEVTDTISGIQVPVPSEKNTRPVEREKLNQPLDAVESQVTALPAVTDPVTSPAFIQTSSEKRSILYLEGGKPEGTGTAEASTVTWTYSPPRNGEGARLHADVTFPEKGMRTEIRFLINKNAPQAASHVVEVGFPSTIGVSKIADIPGLVLKPTEEARGNALYAASVRERSDLYRITLSSLPKEQERNLQLMKERSWIDIPLLFENGRRGILTLEADNVLHLALADWEKRPQETKSTVDKKSEVMNTQELGAHVYDKVPSGTYIVQVDSQRSVSVARENYTKMQSKYPTLLGNVFAAVVKADLGDRGTFFRTRIPTTSREAATKLCSRLQAKGADCFVRRQP